MKKNKLELAGRKKDELMKMLHDAKDALFTMRLDHVQRKLKNTRSIFHKRHEIARIMTKLKEGDVKHE